MRALFLDRDGVINQEKRGDYIRRVEEFVFYPGVLDSLVELSGLFDYLIVVTNQRGIGRGLMTEEQLKAIHHAFLKQVESAGGRIDAIYYAPHIDNAHPRRKPNVGMALEAKKDFPNIEFEQSIMVGNNLSDMQFGKTMHMKTIFLSTTSAPQELPHPLIDAQYPSLAVWCQSRKFID